MNVFDELECLVEWAVNNEVLILASLSICFTYLEMFMVTDNNVFRFSIFLCRFDVFNKCVR